MQLIEESEKSEAEFIQQIKSRTSISYQEICDAFNNSEQKAAEKLDYSVITVNHKFKRGKPLGFEKYNPDGERLNKRISKALIGKSVRWTGWVKRVSGGWLTDYGCEVDFDPPEQSFSSSEVEFKTTEAIAAKLKRENRIEFEGTIRDVSGLLKPYITLDNNPRILSGLSD